jgi:hypothetical protein
LSSKLLTQDKQHFADLAVEAVLRLKGSTNLSYIQVNKKLGKTEWSLEEVLTYYEKVGDRNRSPVWTKEDMNEVDYRSFIKGFLTGSAILSVFGGVYYFMSKIE